MKSVLLIEDETMLRSNVARAIAKLGVTVDEAGTLNDALRVIDRRSPDVVVSDIDLPERSGLELLGELGRRGLNPPVLFVSGYLHAYRAQIPPHAAIEVLEKPVSIDELRSAVSRRLGGQPAGEDTPPFSVPDYLQLACLGQHSVVVEVERYGERVGEIVAAEGTIWSARDTKGGGLEALARLAFGRSGAPRCRRVPGGLPTRNLQGSWEYLLIEAARVMDESGREADVVEAAAELGTIVPGPDAAFDAAFDEGIDALLAKDHATAAQAFERARALRPSDAKVLANLARLAQLGFSVVEGELK
jgi:CheY-like chemotaxis protein